MSTNTVSNNNNNKKLEEQETLLKAILRIISLKDTEIRGNERHWALKG